MKQHILVLIFIIISFSIFAQSNRVEGLNNGTVTILHTNDIHGNFSRFPRLAFVVDSIRNIHKNVLLVNAGDIFSGNPLVDMDAEKGFQMIELMNKLGYDLSVLGNHEFDYGQDVLSKRISEANFPFICANIWNNNGTFPIPQPLALFTFDKSFTVNIISLLDNSINGLPETHPRGLKGLMFTNPIETAKKFEHLKSNSNLFIALTHLGATQDVKLAQSMPSLDLIIGGHSHSKIDSLFIANGVLITQAASHLKYLGEITIVFKDGKIEKKNSKLIALNKNGSVNAEIKKLIDKYKQNPMFSEQIGIASEDIKGKEELGSLFTDALRTEANLDIAFQNSGGLRIDELSKGEIIMEQIFKLDPFGNYLMVLNMNVNEIKSLIRSAFLGEGIDLRVSGIHYTLFTKNGEIKNIHITDYQGNELDKDKLYKVGMNDFILSFYKFEHKDPGQSFGVTTTEILISYIKKKRSINYKGVQRTFYKND